MTGNSVRVIQLAVTEKGRRKNAFEVGVLEPILTAEIMLSTISMRYRMMTLFPCTLTAYEKPRHNLIARTFRRRSANGVSSDVGTRAV